MEQQFEDRKSLPRGPEAFQYPSGALSMVGARRVPADESFHPLELPLVKSIKLWWNPNIIGNGDVIGFLFGDRKETRRAAELLIQKFKEREDHSFSRWQLRRFAEDLDSGDLGVKYSYHNFYTRLLRKLLTLGFVEKTTIWSPKRRTTIRVYRLRVQVIPRRPPESGSSEWLG